MSYREIVIRNKKPRKLDVQAEVYLSEDNNVNYRKF
jgi:hypothetical protein